MKGMKYHLFGGADFYPLGGWNDLLGVYLTVTDACIDVANKSGIDWWHIVGIDETGYSEMVHSGKRI